MLKKTLTTVLLCILVCIFIYPMVFTICNSFMTESEITENYDTKDKEYIDMKLIPEQVTIKQYYRILIKNPQYLFMFWNSVILVVPITVGQIIVALMAAYFFTISKSRWKEPLFFIYIIVMLMPYQVTLVPNYIIAQKFKLVGSYLSIILPGIFNTFGVFLLRQYMKNIPHTYIEAAKIDGASSWQIFKKIILPMSKSGVAALAILTFIDNWNMVEQPLIFLNDPIKEPLSIYLSNINANAKGISFAASVLYMMPMLLVFMYWENYLVEGIQHSGIKG